MSIRFNKESKIKFLKRKYTPTSNYYSWYTVTGESRRYFACGKHIVQEILRSAQAEGINVEEYVYEYDQFYATSDICRLNWSKYLENRRERHIINCKLRKNIRSKDKRKRSRNDVSAMYIFLNT